MIQYVICLVALIFSLAAFAVPPVPPDDLRCMADNIYFESTGEPLVGQALVGISVMERVKDKRWPDTICGVIYQHKQYSWTAEERKAIEDKESYKLIEYLSQKLLENRDKTPVIKVTNYLRCDWRPKVEWWKSMTFLGQIGDHCFYEDNE